MINGSSRHQRSLQQQWSFWGVSPTRVPTSTQSNIGGSENGSHQPEGAGEDLQRRSEHPQIQVKTSPGASTKDWVKNTDVNAMF